MSIEEQIAQLEELVATDTQIKSLEEEIQREREQIDGVRNEAAAISGRLASDREAVTEMDRTRNDLMLELRQMDKQVERSRERLQRSRNEREINAAERELDELRKLQRDRDDEIKKLIGLTDQARTTIAENEGREKALSDQFEGSIEGVTKRLNELEASLAEARTARAGMGTLLPSRVFRRYESLLKRGGVPVAHTTDGTCLGCNIRLPPMLFHEMLSTRQFSECPNCHRILYYRPPKPAGDDDEASEESASR